MFYVYLGPCYIGERKHTVFDDTQGRLFNTCLTFFAPEIIFSPKSEDDEYFMDTSVGYDSKSDLWSLGMIYMYLFHASVEGKEANELFKASNLETFIFHEFTTIGFPALSEVPYMDKMEYNRLKKKTQGYLRQKANPEASELLMNDSKSFIRDNEFLSKILKFDPSHRPDSKTFLTDEKILMNN